MRAVVFDDCHIGNAARGRTDVPSSQSLQATRWMEGWTIKWVSGDTRLPPACVDALSEQLGIWKAEGVYCQRDEARGSSARSLRDVTGGEDERIVDV